MIHERGLGGLFSTRIDARTVAPWTMSGPAVGLWTLVVIAALLVSIAAPAALAQPPAKVKVLIAFHHQPGPAEQALVQGVGGDIKYTYSLVPAIAASMPAAALEGLGRNPNVVRVELDAEAQVVDAELDNAWGVEHIGAGTVHAAGNKGGGVKVAVLDTGIDTDHPDLNYDPTCSASFVAGESLEDGHSHGTHTAGTLAALDNDTGVVGVAPEVTLCIYKVLGNSGNGDYSDIIAGIERAVMDGVQVTNNSYGSSGDPGATVQEAFDNATAAGLLHIGAAGNYGNAEGTGDNCIYPGRWNSVVATAATTQSDVRASLSSTCAEVELAAPGDQIYSTMPGAGYGYKSGTSMASPHAAGVAALILAANPGWSNDQVRTQLQTTANDLGDPGRDVWYGYGLVDAVEAAGLHPPLADDQSVTTAEDVPVATTLTGSDPDGDPLTFSLVVGPSNGTLIGTAPDLTYTPSPGFSGADSFTFKVSDGLLESAPATVSITVTPLEYVEAVASSEVYVVGSVSGDYTFTQADDGATESITEQDSGGKPQNRYSYLEHKWVLNVNPGSAVTLYANAWSSGSSDGDNFLFAYSTDGANYIGLFEVANTSDTGHSAYSLPASTQGTVYVRVTDSDHSAGNRAQDTVYVDHLVIRSLAQPGDPPAAPSGLNAAAVSASQIDLTWIDNATDESGFQIERSPDGANWSQIDTVGVGATSYADMTVTPNTTYYYQVRAYNGSGSSGYSNVASASTPDGLSLAANGYKIKGKQVVDLAWSGGSASSFYVYRDGNSIASAVSGDAYTDNIGVKGGGSYSYQICEAGSLTRCSNTVRVVF